MAPAAFMRFLTRWHGLDEPASELDQGLALAHPNIEQRCRIAHVTDKIHVGAAV